MPVWPEPPEDVQHTLPWSVPDYTKEKDRGGVLRPISGDQLVQQDRLGQTEGVEMNQKECILPTARDAYPLWSSLTSARDLTPFLPTKSLPPSTAAVPGTFHQKPQEPHFLIVSNLSEWVCESPY